MAQFVLLTFFKILMYNYHNGTVIRSGKNINSTRPKCNLPSLTCMDWTKSLRSWPERNTSSWTTHDPTFLCLLETSGWMMHPFVTLVLSKQLEFSHQIASQLENTESCDWEPPQQFPYQGEKAYFYLGSNAPTLLNTTNRFWWGLAWKMLVISFNH